MDFFQFLVQFRRFNIVFSYNAKQIYKSQFIVDIILGY